MRCFFKPSMVPPPTLPLLFSLSPTIDPTVEDDLEVAIEEIFVVVEVFVVAGHRSVNYVIRMVTWLAIVFDSRLSPSLHLPWIMI
jgi:hypothetical protein